MQKHFLDSSVALWLESRPSQFSRIRRSCRYHCGSINWRTRNSINIKNFSYRWSIYGRYRRICTNSPFKYLGTSPKKGPVLQMVRPYQGLSRGKLRIAWTPSSSWRRGPHQGLTLEASLLWGLSMAYLAREVEERVVVAMEAIANNWGSKGY